MAEMIKVPTYESAVEEYSCGKCMWLAIAMHDLYGWRISNPTPPFSSSIQIGVTDGGRIT